MVVAPTAASAEGTEAAVQVVVAAAAAAVRCGVCVCVCLSVQCLVGGVRAAGVEPAARLVVGGGGAGGRGVCAAAASGARDRDHHPEEVARSQRGGAGERCMRVRKMRGRTRCAN